MNDKLSGRSSRWWIAAGTLALAAALPAGPSAEDVGKWSDVAEFSYVVTAGNSETATIGLKNTLSREWDRALFTLRAGGIRAESTAITRFAVGAPGNFQAGETSLTEKTAENYFVDGRYDRKITDRFFWYAGSGWYRNRFAGIENRYGAQGGVGNIWLDRDDLKFRTDYGVTYTKQEDVVEDPTRDDTFPGWRVSWAYLNKLGANATYENLLVVDGNLDETSDYRADMINSLSVAMSARMALKVSLQWLYDNEPSFALAPLFDLPPSDPLATQIGTARVQLDDLDTVFTASLVVNF